MSLVERKSGYVVLGKLHKRTAAEVNQRAVRLIRRQPRTVRTITADNGTEFHSYAAIEQATAARFYFATPIEHPISLDSRLVMESGVQGTGVRDVGEGERASQGGAS